MPLPVMKFPIVARMPSTALRSGAPRRRSWRGSGASRRRTAAASHRRQSRPRPSGLATGTAVSSKIDLRTWDLEHYVQSGQSEDPHFKGVCFTHTTFLKHLGSSFDDSFSSALCMSREEWRRGKPVWHSSDQMLGSRKILRYR